MAEPSEEAKEQVVAYMRHQASKPTDDLLALIDRAHGVIERSLEGVSEEQAKLCPEPGEWCIGDILRHVEKSMRGTADVIEAVGKGEKADLSGMAPVIESGPETLAELREGVARSFDELKSAVRAIPEGATSTAYHPFFGDLTCREWAAFVYVHARDHAEQIEKAKRAPGSSAS
jgi:DinB superfamily